MANYSINRLCARGSLRSLASLQAAEFEPGFGPMGHEHRSRWGSEDGICVLNYSGSTRHRPPIEEVEEMAKRHPDCLFELSFFDEGLGYEGWMSIHGGKIIAVGEMLDDDREATGEDFAEAGNPFHDLERASDSHWRQMAMVRAQAGLDARWRAADPLFDNFMRALARDDPNAWGLGEGAGVAPARRAMLAILMDAPASLGEEARAALDSMGEPRLARMLHPSLCATATPWGALDGFRALAALHGGKAPGWVEGGWVPGSPGMLLISRMAAHALVQPGEDGEVDAGAVGRRMERLWSGSDPRGLLLSGSAGLEDAEGGRLSLGERIVLLGCSDSGAIGARHAVCAEAFMARAKEVPGAWAWIDQAYARLAREALAAGKSPPRSEGAAGESILARVAPALSDGTLAALPPSGLVGPAGAAMVEAIMLGRAAGAPAPGRRRRPL